MTWHTAADIGHLQLIGEGRTLQTKCQHCLSTLKSNKDMI